MTEKTQINFYTKENCSQCNIAKVKLYRGGIEYQEINITPEILEQLKETYNYVGRTLPIIEVVGDSVYDFSSVEEFVKKHGN